MTATPAPKPHDKEPIPPKGIYRATTAHWANGTIKVLYCKIKGQGTKVLVEERPGDECVELGHRYQLTLVRIEEGAEVPPIEMPTFPKLPAPPIELLPEGVSPPIYFPPMTPQPPIYEFPGYPVQPPIYQVPGYPGVVPPIYQVPGYPVQPPIYGPYAPKSPPIYKKPDDDATPDPDEED